MKYSYKWRGFAANSSVVADLVSILAYQWDYCFNPSTRHISHVEARHVTIDYLLWLDTFCGI